MAERAVYVGGLGSGKGVAERTAEVLEDVYNYNDVDHFTFSRAIGRPDILARAVKGVDLWTHSAGFLAAKDTQPQRIEAFNAPIPTSRPRLVAGSAFKLLRMHTPTIGLKKFQDIPTVLGHDASTVAEFASHPWANLSQLSAISRFDAIHAAQAARKAGIPTALAYTEGDEYFQPSFPREIEAWHHGVEFTRLEGIHDELVIRPAQLLRAYLEKKELRQKRLRRAS